MQLAYTDIRDIPGDLDIWPNPTSYNAELIKPVHEFGFSSFKLSVEANKLIRALNYSDLKKARKNNKQIVIQSVEGGDFIEGKLERIQTALVPAGE